MLRTLKQLARTVMIQCDTADEVAQRRYIERERANPRKRPDVLAATIAQMERGTYPWELFAAFDLGVPALHVDTTDGYEPGLDAIVAWCRAGRTGEGAGAAPGDGAPRTAP